MLKRTSLQAVLLVLTTSGSLAHVGAGELADVASREEVPSFVLRHTDVLVHESPASAPAPDVQGGRG